MSDRPTSFHDFKWACGHTGPGYCKTCRDEQIEAKDKRIAELEDALQYLQSRFLIHAEYCQAIHRRTDLYGDIAAKENDV